MEIKVIKHLYNENGESICKEGDKVKMISKYGASMTGEISDISLSEYSDEDFEETKVWLNNCVYMQVGDIKSIQKVEEITKI